MEYLEQQLGDRPYFAEDFTVVLDDIHRVAERQILERWSELLHLPSERRQIRGEETSRASPLRFVDLRRSSSMRLVYCWSRYSQGCPGLRLMLYHIRNSPEAGS